MYNFAIYSFHHLIFIAHNFYHFHWILFHKVINYIFVLYISSLFNFRAVIRELLDTEEEYGRDLQNVVDRYIKAVEGAAAPRTVRDSKDIIFGNFQQIAEFHNM